MIAIEVSYCEYNITINFNNLSSLSQRQFFVPESVELLSVVASLLSMKGEVVYSLHQLHLVSKPPRL